MTKIKTINLLSGPRNVSTALMYAFAQRPDTKVVDEPFYAHYLTAAGLKHPGRDKVLKSQSNDPEKVIDQLLNNRKKDLLFIKNMAHHMIEMDEQLEVLIKEFSTVFLIREPREMLLSLSKNIPSPALRDTAYVRQLQLHQQIKSLGKPVHVLDSKALLTDPESVLTKLCNQLEIDFQKTMLSWNAGPIPEDGVWAEYWYNAVHKSTKFNPYQSKDEVLPDRLKPLYNKCKPIYEQLVKYAIQA